MLPARVLELAFALDAPSWSLLHEAFGACAAPPKGAKRDPRALLRAIAHEPDDTPLAAALVCVDLLRTPLGQAAIDEAARDVGLALEGSAARAGPADRAAWLVAGAHAKPAKGVCDARSDHARVLERARIRVARTAPTDFVHELRATGGAGARNVDGGRARAAAGCAGVRGDAIADSLVVEASSGDLAIVVARRTGDEQDKRVRVDRIDVAADASWVRIAAADPARVPDYAGALGLALHGDARAFGNAPTFTLAMLRTLRAPALAKKAWPAPVRRVRVVAVAIDTGRGTRIEAGGRDPLGELAPVLRSGGYVPRATLRLDIEGSPSPVDATLLLPHAIAISDGRFEGAVRAALGALGVTKPGAVPDDLVTLAPWVHPEWRWVGAAGAAEVAAMRAAGLLAPQLGDATRRVATADFRASGRSHVTFALTHPGDRGKHYAVPETLAMRARSVDDADRVMLALDLAKLREAIAGRLGADRGHPVRLPKGFADLGVLAGEGGARARFVLLTRAIERREAKAVARALRRADAGAQIVVLSPRAHALGRDLAEAPIGVAEQLGVGDYAAVLRAAERELGMKLNVSPAALTSRATPLVVTRDPLALYLLGVPVTGVSDNMVRVVLELASAGGPLGVKDLGWRIVADVANPDQVVRKARLGFEERALASLRDAGIAIDDEVRATIGRIVVREGKGSYRLGVGVVVAG